jgi:hypothetical protein
MDELRHRMRWGKTCWSAAITVTTTSSTAVQAARNPTPGREVRATQQPRHLQTARHAVRGSQAVDVREEALIQSGVHQHGGHGRRAQEVLQQRERVEAELITRRMGCTRCECVCVARVCRLSA